MHSPMYCVTFVAYLLAAVGGAGNDETPLRSRLTEKEYPSWSTSNAVRTATPLFRVGSGAAGPSASSSPSSPRGLAEAERLKPTPRFLQAKSIVEAERPKLSTVVNHNAVKFFPPILVLSVLVLMMPSGTTNFNAGQRDFNYRIPPSWTPENEATYSFRAYMTDMSIWIMLTDLQPHQQCAAIVMRLGGAAREMARMISPQEMMHGGQVNGQALGPVEYLLGSLHGRFSALEEESRLTSMTEMLAFTRKPGETINALLARYETVRQRGALEGRFVMSIEGYSLQLLRACGIGTQHLLTLLQPFQGQLPQTEPQFRQLCTQLRRFGHISEQTPGNIATSLQGPFRQARPGSYHVLENQQGLREATQSTTSGAVSSFFGSTQDQASPGDPWASLIPQDPTFGFDPFATWSNQPIQPQVQAANQGGSRTTEAAGPPVPFDMEEDSSTDSETSSDDGTAIVGGPDISQMSEAEAAEAIFYEYRKAKRTWRRFTGKPVRRFRRTFKRTFKSYGKGKSYGKSYGKGKRRGFFFTKDEVFAYLKGKGKGHRMNSSGKGHGRRKNPRDRNGDTMKCRICGSEEHFQAECPQNGGSSQGGKGGNSSSSQGPTFFHGLTSVTTGAERDNTGNRTVESDVSPPWDGADDLMFEAPREYFPVFGEGDSTPFRQFDDSHQSYSGPDAFTLGVGSAVAAAAAASSQDGAQRVTYEDELSDSSVEGVATLHTGAQWPTVDLTPPSAPRVPPPPLPQIPIPQQAGPVNLGPNPFATSAANGSDNPWQNFQSNLGNDPLRHIPAQLRQDSSITGNQLLRIIEGQELTGTNRRTRTERDARRERENPGRSIFHQTTLPISCAFSPSVRPAESVALQAPQQSQSSMSMIEAAVAMSATARGATVTDGSMVMPPRPVAEATPMTIEQRTQEAAASPVPQDRDLDNVVPLIYDGVEDRCSICADQFQAGDRVCRLTCRHMFHAQCWDSYVNANRSRAEFSHCPNCRGAGTLMAIWNYVDANGSITQEVGGRTAENLLEARSERHSISTPPASSPRQNEPNHAATSSSTFVVQTSEGPPSYHIRTRLADGRPSITIDPGSVGNLCGDKWAKEVARAAAQNHHKPTYEKRPRPLTVSGVGHGSQECHYDCKLPVALQQTEGRGSVLGSLTAPAVANSDLPGLLGLNALRKNRAILDFSTLRLHFCGPAGIEMEKHLPPGSESFQTELAPSGHMVLPCCEFQRGSIDKDHTLTLITQGNSATSVGDRSGSGRKAEAERLKPETPIDNSQAIGVATMIPPPPPKPPVLPRNVHLSTEVPAPPSDNH